MLLKRIDCSKYLISTNGNSHNHPDIETIARIALVNNESETEILLNYELEKYLIGLLKSFLKITHQ